MVLVHGWSLPLPIKAGGHQMCLEVAQERGHHCVTAGHSWGGERPVKIPKQLWDAQVPPSHEKQNTTSSDISTRHQECLTLAATSMAWSPTALRGGRRAVSTEPLSLVTCHSTWHRLSSLQSQKILVGTRGRGSTTLSRSAWPILQLWEGWGIWEGLTNADSQVAVICEN